MSSSDAAFASGGGEVEALPPSLLLLLLLSYNKSMWHLFLAADQRWGQGWTKDKGGGGSNLSCLTVQVSISKESYQANCLIVVLSSKQ